MLRTLGWFLDNYEREFGSGDLQKFKSEVSLCIEMGEEPVAICTLGAAPLLKSYRALYTGAAETK